MRRAMTFHTLLAAFAACMLAQCVSVPRASNGNQQSQTPAAAVPVPDQAANFFPLKENSIRFAVIGDNGNGDTGEYEIGTRMADRRQRFPFDFVVMVGDNIYGSERPQDFVQKFEQPYKALLDANVKFYAAIGNHDDPNQRFYKPFNMNGERYYTYSQGSAQFFALDSNYMDAKQLAWLESALKESSSDWKICYFHHPLYSSGSTHGSELDLRTLVEPLFVQHGVSVVFTGHEHFYQRIKPQKGITYFVSGAAGQLRPGDIRPAEFSATGFDKDQSFMLVEIAGDQLFFQAVTRTGAIVDSGVVERRTQSKPAS